MPLDVHLFSRDGHVDCALLLDNPLTDLHLAGLHPSLFGRELLLAQLERAVSCGARRRGGIYACTAPSGDAVPGVADGVLDVLPGALPVAALVVPPQLRLR